MQSESEEEERGIIVRGGERKEGQEKGLESWGRG